MSRMNEEQFRIYLENAAKEYNIELEGFKEKGYLKVVEWETIRKLRVYLYNKGLEITPFIFDSRGLYISVVLENYIIVEGKRVTLSMIMITPEDTSDSAHGKAKRIMVAEFEKHLQVKENNQ